MTWLEEGTQFDSYGIGADYYLFKSEWSPGHARYIFAKIVNRESLGVSIFCYDPIDGSDCYNLSYAVHPKHQRRGLALEAVNKGLESLSSDLKTTGMKSFILEAIVDVENIPFIKTAEKIFSSDGSPDVDHETGTPTLNFKKLINLK